MSGKIELVGRCSVAVVAMPFFCFQSVLQRVFDPTGYNHRKELHDLL